MKVIKGDLLKEFETGTVDAILHVCNCQRVMGAGIAFQIKNRYPQAYQAYMDHPIELDLMGHSYLELGTISYTSSLYKGGGYIFNLHAQNLYGSGSRFLNYEALYVTLEKVRDVLQKDGFKGVIGVPKYMGAFRAGGDWRIVEKMLECVFEDFSDIVIVDFNK